MTATSRFRRFAAAVTFFLLAAATAFSASPFYLSETKSHALYGPFTLYDGAKIRVAGTLYSLSVAGDRITFGGVPGGPFGPYQTVNGRIMRIGDSMYSFFWKDAVRTQPVAPVRAPEPPIAEFDPMPPMPERIEVPEPESRHVEPLDLPPLPDATKPVSWFAWVAPVDNTPIEWKIESAKGNETDYKRTSLGGGLAINSWFSSLRLSTGGKSGDIVKKGMGVTSSSLSDGTGFALEAGYKRPFLSQNGWVASGGIYGMLRRDKADLKTRSLIHTSETDTNNVTNIKSYYRTRTSSLKLTEYTLGLDIDLAYVTDFWSAYVGVLIQPLSSLDVSGGLPYGDDDLKLEASHDDPLAARIGGWYEMDAGWRITAEAIFGMETLIRLGVWRNF